MAYSDGGVGVDQCDEEVGGAVVVIAGLRRRMVLDGEAHDSQVWQFAFWRADGFAYDAEANHWKPAYPPDEELLVASAAEEVPTVFGPIEVLDTRDVLPQHSYAAKVRRAIMFTVFKNTDRGVLRSGRHYAWVTRTSGRAFDFPTVTTTPDYPMRERSRGI